MFFLWKGSELLACLGVVMLGAQSAKAVSLDLGNTGMYI